MSLSNLPDAAAARDPGHIDDHNKILAALQALDSAKVENIIIGVVQTGAPGSDAAAELVNLGGGLFSLNITIPAGADGAAGATGATGAPGPAGDSYIPSGGAARTFLMKATSTDFDFTYAVPSASDVGAVPTTRAVNTGTGLTGGGSLTSDRTLAVDFGTVAGKVLEGDKLGYAPGLTGAGQATRFVGATTSGAPVSGTFSIGDWIISRGGSVYICTAAGTPGTWAHIPNTTYILGKIADIEYIAPGSMVNVSESGGTYTRPTARTDICVTFTGTSDPGSVALPGDKWDRI